MSEYAEGTRRPSVCSLCGQPITLVFHGPNANHTVEAALVAAAPDYRPLRDHEVEVRTIFDREYIPPEITKEAALELGLRVHANALKAVRALSVSGGVGS